MNQILHKSQDVVFKTLVHDPIGKRHSLKKLETRVMESDGNFSFRSSLFERWMSFRASLIDSYCEFFLSRSNLSWMLLNAIFVKKWKQNCARAKEFCLDESNQSSMHWEDAFKKRFKAFLRLFLAPYKPRIFCSKICKYQVFWDFVTRFAICFGWKEFGIL